MRSYRNEIAKKRNAGDFNHLEQVTIVIV